MNAPARIETGVVDIRGKQYQTVALRVQMFRQEHPDKALTTEVVERDQECVVMKATIAAEDGRVLATGHSEEYRKASQINRTSALENAETSAIGRALAAFGYGGTEFATANEVQNAIHQQGREGQSGSDRTVSPPAEMPDSEWAKLVQLIEATKADRKAMLDYYKVQNLRQLDQDQYGHAIKSLTDKLAKAAKDETDAKAGNLAEALDDAINF